ncbi:MAG: hypothetical protein DYG85_05200 [Chloroflexi bacterium CFX1]|nr:hypothetical protein [Chloroflexi bacterium CFX1]MCQ3953072.1 hypothetical protein [Chloroflexota bacterium]MDL1919111.1 hypothetical protein [Chloroflexi bacterium CFX5]NUQ59545.1 hypothetical protein [Anaerolineales bacterium]
MTRRTILTLTLLLLAGCAPASPPPETDLTTQTQPPPESPSTTPQPTETEPAVPEIEAQNVFTFDEMGIAVGFDFPEGFSEAMLTGAAGVYEPNAPYDLPYPPRAYILFTANPGDDMKVSGIRVFRVEDINALQAGVVENLFAVLEGQADHHNDFPRLAGAGNLIDAQLTPLDFENGMGYRFLLTKSFSADPLQNSSMTYMYQGITDDEKYFVSFIASVEAPFLAQYVNQPLTTVEEFEAFYLKINGEVDAADESQFAPSLAVLDALVASVIAIEK